MIETPSNRIPRRQGWQRLIAGFVVVVKRRLIAPMLWGRQSPEYFARASAIGLFINFTPSVGIQIPMTIGIWTLVRLFVPKWDFHLGLACAWTLLTNVATIPPLYTLFVFTGRLMLGYWSETNGLGAFFNQLKSIWQADMQGMDSWWQPLIDLWNLFGLPLFIGSLPWGMGFGWMGYVWTIWFIVRHRRRKQKTIEKKEGSGDSSPGFCL